jgi:hypothetical protein
MGIKAGEDTFYQAQRGIVQDGLVLNLDAGVDESYSGGTTWRDLKSSNNGTLTNGPTFDSERGGSIVVDGSDDLIHVSDSDDVSFDTFNNFTISMWCKLATSQGSWKAIFAYSSSGSNSFTLQRYSSTSQIRMFRGGNNSESLGDIFSNIFTGNWINLVLTYDSSSGTVCYVNNSSIGTTGAFSIASVSSPTLRILCERTGLSTEGEIAAFAIYNKTLTATEITQNYNATRYRFGV